MVISPVNRRFDGILIEPERSRVRWTLTSFEFFSRGRACAVLSLETRDDEEEGRPPNKGGIGRTSRKIRIEIDRSRVSIEFCARRFYIFQIFASDFQFTSSLAPPSSSCTYFPLLFCGLFRLSKFVSRDFAATRPTISNFLRCFSKG